MRRYIHGVGLAALALWLIAPGAAYSSPMEARMLAGRLAGLISPFESLVVKTRDEEVYIALPAGARPAEGALARVLDANRNTAAWLRVKAVEDKYAVLSTVRAMGEIIPGVSKARGLAAPARILWLAKGETAAEIFSLAMVEEAVRDRGVFDLAPPEAARSLIENIAPARLDEIGAEAIGKMAAKTRSDIVALATAREEGDFTLISITVAAPDGYAIAGISGRMGIERAVTASRERDEEDIEPAPAEKAQEPGAPGFLRGKWKGSSALAAAAPSSQMSVRDKLKWKKWTVDGAALSALLFRPAPGVDHILAAVFDGSLRVYQPAGDTLKKIWESEAVSGLRLISAAAHDTNGDGAQEIFVNACREGVLSSFVVESSEKGFETVAVDVPYYFSASSDGVLLAQKSSGDTRVVMGDVYTVTRSADRLEFIPAFALKGNEIPIGLNRVDADGDGTPEVIGMSPRGRLLIFTQSGDLAWRGADFGTTGRTMRIPTGERESVHVSIPPTPLAISEGSLGLMLVTGGAQYKPGGILERAGLEKGAVRFIRIKEEEYVVLDSIVSAGGWISSLIEAAQTPGGRPAAVGFIRVLPGVISDESEIFTPVPDSGF